MALFQQFFPQQKQQNSLQRQPIDQKQFRQLAVTLDKNSLQQLVQRARQQGVSEQDIEAGINFILNLRQTNRGVY